MSHRVQWCPTCDSWMVVCSVCGNNCCNGGGSSCCTEAYAFQERIFDGQPNLFIDDERTPPDETWCVARTAEQAYLVLAEGRWARISFDHDLGDESDGTGYDVACWLEQKIHDDPTYPVPTLSVHSSNPVGRARIEQVIQSIGRIVAGRTARVGGDP